MDLNHLLNSVTANPAVPDSRLQYPMLPGAATSREGETKAPANISTRPSSGSPMRRPRWPPSAPTTRWDTVARSRSEGRSFEGQDYKLDHTGLQHNFSFTPMISEGPPIFSPPNLQQSQAITPRNLSTAVIFPYRLASSSHRPGTYYSLHPHPHHPPLPFSPPPPLPPPPPAPAHATSIIVPARAMKRTASRAVDNERRRKRTPMRSIGALVRPAEDAYAPSPESDMEQSLTPQSVPASRHQLSRFSPAHPARMSGGASLVGNGISSGYVRSIGDTNGTSRGFVNGIVKPSANVPSNSVVRDTRKRDINGVGNTVVIDLTDEPSNSELSLANSPTFKRSNPSMTASAEDSEVIIVEPTNPSSTPSRSTANSNGVSARKSRPSKSSTRISPAARWEAKMEARNATFTPSPKLGAPRVGSSSSKAGPSSKSNQSNGSKPLNGIAPGHTTPTGVLNSNGAESAVIKKKKKKRVRKKKQAPPPDPDVPYPSFSENLECIPKEAVGDMLQIYDFCIAFSKVLRLSPFSLRTLELALSIQERNPLIDSIVVRLVKTMLEDRAVAAELDLSQTTVGSLKVAKAADATEKTFDELPNLFIIDDQDDGDSFADESLRNIVLKMRSAANTWSLYELTPGERLRVLRELIDRTASTEELRACVIHSVEFEDEERKKAREDLFSQRRQAENELRDMRADILAFREKHGLLPSAIAAAAAEARAKEEAEKAAAKKKSKKKSKTKSSGGPPPKMTRKQLIVAAQKERAEAAKRKLIEREEAQMNQRIEALKEKINSIKSRTAKPGTKKKEATDGEGFSPEEAAARAAAAEAAAEAEVHLDRAERNQDDPVRMHALGTDREFRRYWYFVGGGRLWVENPASNSWMYAEEPALIENLLQWCSPHRERERALKTVLEKRKLEIEDGMKMLAKTKDKESAARERKSKAPRTRLGKRKSRDSGMSSADAADVPYLSYRNTLG